MATSLKPRLALFNDRTNDFFCSEPRMVKKLCRAASALKTLPVLYNISVVAGVSTYTHVGRCKGGRVVWRKGRMPEAA